MPQPISRKKKKHKQLIFFYKTQIFSTSGLEKSLVDSIFTDSGKDFNYAGTFRRMSELMTAKIAQQAVQIYHPDILINIPLNASGLLISTRKKNLKK